MYWVGLVSVCILPTNENGIKGPDRHSSSALLHQTGGWIDVQMKYEPQQSIVATLKLVIILIAKKFFIYDFVDKLKQTKVR